jgi:hypothetical protein
VESKGQPPFWSPIPVFGVPCFSRRRSVQGFAIVYSPLSSPLLFSHPRLAYLRRWNSTWSNWHIPSKQLHLSPGSSDSSTIIISTTRFSTRRSSVAAHSHSYFLNSASFLLTDCVDRLTVVWCNTCSQVITTSYETLKMLIKGEKYACEACVRGHRVSNCQHSDRPLQHINKKVHQISAVEVPVR